MSLQDKVIIITGANSGVGAAAAKLLASKGAKVVIAARRKDKLDAVADEIKAKGGEAAAVQCDISKNTDCENLVKVAMDTFGKVDGLVNDAAVLDTNLHAIDDFDDAELQKLISINQVGTMQMLRATVKVMKTGASIVNIASVAGVNGGGGAAYVSTKAALIGITKHCAMLLAKEGIRCNAICPGTIVTPMVAGMDPAKLNQRMIGAMSVHSDLTLQPCQPEDVANIIAFLSSDESRAITGQILVTDFGANL